MRKADLSERLVRTVKKAVAAGYTVSSIAEAAGCTRQYLNLILAGQRTPTLDLAARIAEAAGGRITVEVPRRIKKQKTGKR